MVISAGHLVHKTNPDLSYFKLSYVFWEHNNSVGQGTTAVSFDDVRVEKYKQLENEKCYFGQRLINRKCLFWIQVTFLIFWTFIFFNPKVYKLFWLLWPTLGHSRPPWPPDSGGPDCLLQLWCIWQRLRSFMSSKSILGFIDSVSNLCLTCQPPKQLPL